VNLSDPPAANAPDPVVTPNNATIDAYAALDLTAEPAVIFVSTLVKPRWYIVQIGGLTSAQELKRSPK